MSTDLIGPVLLGLLDCASRAVPDVGRAYVSPGGPIAWDNCCDGQLWTRLVSIEPQPVNNRGGGVGGAGSTAYPCGVLMWLVTVGVGVLRCASTVNDQGQAPPVGVLTPEALQVTGDAAALMEAIQCCGSATARVHRLLMVRWDPLGPDGGCVGGEWTATFTIDNCKCA